MGMYDSSLLFFSSNQIYKVVDDLEIWKSMWWVWQLGKRIRSV